MGDRESRSKAYGHRFKFARVVVSPFIMTIVQNLYSSSVPIEREPGTLLGDEVGRPSVDDGAGTIGEVVPVHWRV